MLAAGDTFGYNWINRNPAWFNLCAFNSLYDIYNSAPSLRPMHPIPVEINSKTTSDENETPWMPAKNGKWQKKANPNVAGDDWNMTGKSCSTQMPINPSNSPPVCTLDPIPILDSADNPAKIAFYLIGNCFSEVDFEYMSGSPQMVAFMAPSTTGAFINTSEKSNVCMFPSGLRHYSGAPNSATATPIPGAKR